MNKKYKININPEIPTDKEIAESMDFNKLMKQTNDMYKPLDFRKKMHRKRNVIMVVICAIALALVLLYGI